MQSYRTWEDLRDEGPAVPAGAGAKEPDAASGAVDALPSREVPPSGSMPRSAPAPGSSGDRGLRRELLARLAGDVELPADVLALLDEYERAEENLRRLTGQLPPEPSDPREAARFPLKAHSAASRLEEKRLASLDEQASTGRKRLQERRAIDAARERRTIAVAKARRDAARRAVVRLRIAEERAREHRAAEAARAAAIERDRARWELDRHRALQRTRLARRELAAHAERQLDQVRGRQLELRRALRAEAERDDERRARALSRRRSATQHG